MTDWYSGDFGNVQQAQRSPSKEQFMDACGVSPGEGDVWEEQVPIAAFNVDNLV